jgi:hypothetical protein
MKRVLILSLAGALALPLFAEEPKSTETKPADAPKQTTVAPANADSPLVQAAKRSNRKNGKKAAIVITNESLRASKGHITTTSAQAPINVPEPTPGPEQQLAEKQAKRAADAKRLEETRAANAKKAAAHRETVRRNAAQSAEEGLYEGLDTDPAEAEHAAGSTSGKPPL